ncbi:hypothetical protein TIFTF001_020490 [Ficus carica]|uniref:Retrotransposon gag domain-containing protein n=1 Tax=Ficus carica TaxID=3494 RepID=A0AA88AAV8_FICCA|nr:hypothetical protein TIFTF001_020490 [Ficus carica]
MPGRALAIAMGEEARSDRDCRCCSTENPRRIRSFFLAQALWRKASENGLNLAAKGWKLVGESGRSSEGRWVPVGLSPSGDFTSKGIGGGVGGEEEGGWSLSGDFALGALGEGNFTRWGNFSICPAVRLEASTSGGNAQIANLMLLVEELTQKHNTQQNQMESISAENQILNNQLATITSHAAYSYYYNPYAGYSAGASTGGRQQAMPYYPQGMRTTTHNPVAPMQPLSTPGNTLIATNRQAQQQPAPGPSSRRNTTPTQQSTPELPEGLIPPGTMNVEVMMRNIMSEEVRTLEAQMEQRFSSQLQKTTISTPGFDNLARGVRETPLAKRITNTITPKFGNISFPRFDEPKGAALRWFCNLPSESIDSFDKLSLEFMRSYSVHIQSGKTTKDLWGVVQGPNELLRTYIKCFSKAISEISGLDDGTARKALKKGLRHKSLFKNEIYTRYPPTIQEAMHRAKGFIEMEEENERIECDLAQTRKEAREERER